MIHRIGPQTSVEIPQAAQEAGRGPTPARSREAARAESAKTPESPAGLAKATDRAARGEVDQQKLVEAAQEFEALLLAQILKTARESGSGGWLGAGAGQGMTSTMELAETQLAQAMAEQGALGIGKLLARGFTPHPSLETKSAVEGATEAASVTAERGGPQIKAALPEPPAATPASKNPDPTVAPKPHAVR
jgi:Rod binding domain-containing protein